jgi:acyl-CoA thioester hydrolase
MKPTPERLALRTYPHHTKIEPRFQDLDPLGHLNNVALAGIYEEARVRFTQTFRHPPAGAEGRRPVVAAISVTYLAEGLYPVPLTVATGVLKIGRSSYVTGQALFQNDLCIGTADTVVVFTDAGRPFPLPDEIRDGLAAALIGAPA